MIGNFLVSASGVPRTSPLRLTPHQDGSGPAIAASNLWLNVLLVVFVLSGLYAAKLYSYVLFHSISELFSIVISCSIFIVVWNARKFLTNSYFILIGIGCLFVGFVDTIHTFAYKGMGIFRGYDSDLPTQLWIAGRYIEAVTFLVAPIFTVRKVKANSVMAAYCLVTALFLCAIFFRVFPECFIEGQGLTVFKISSEYIISAMLLASLAFLYRMRRYIDDSVLSLLTASIITAIASEMSFTLYSDVYGLSNMLGHVLKIASFYLMYRAIIVVGLDRPYAVLFRELGKEKDKAQQYLDVASAMFVAIDHDQKVTLINKKGCEVLGYEEEEIVGKNWFDLILPDNARKEMKAVFARLMSGEIESVEYVENLVATKSGKKRMIAWHNAILADEEGHAAGTISSGYDITDRKQAEDALKKSEEKFAKAFRACPEAITIASMEDGRYIEVNNTFLKKTGYQREEVIGFTSTDLGVWADMDTRRRFVEKLSAEGCLTDFEGQYRMRDGMVRDFLVSSEVVEIEGSPCSLSFILDITDRKRAVEEKSHLQSQLLQARKMEAVGTLAGGVAHDFNNILTAIIGFGSIIQMDLGEDDPKMVYVEQILTAAEKAANLTQSLLAFSRKQQINLNPHKINDIIEQTGKLLKRLLTEDIELKIVFAPVNPTILADITQIDQILINLATNARDAMPKGGTLNIETSVVTLDDEFIRLQGYGKPGDYAMLSAADNGVGMDEKTKEQIFEPFFTTKEVGKGTGLGLSTVFGVVKQHGGHIIVNSEPNNGTSFQILFPIVPLKEEEAAHELLDLKGGTETILIAEDDRGVRLLITDILRRYGYTTIEAGDGTKALRAFRDNSVGIGLVVCDVVMPGMNGKEVCDEIRKTRPNMKILFTSGYTRDVIINKGVEDASVDFITKPIKPREFLAKVREVLDR
jgi:PAS domain S-box-containing protein